MSNNRSSTRNNGNAGNSNNNSNQQQNRSPKDIWIVRPSYTIGDCRAYFTKEDALSDFGQPEDSWEFHHDYDIDRGRDLEIWTNAKSPNWDGDFEVQWEMEKVTVRSLNQPTTKPVTPPAVKPATQQAETPTTKTLIPAETEEPKSITDSDTN